MVDRITNIPRGFGFVTFADEAIINEVLAQAHEFNGRPVELRRAAPKQVRLPGAPRAYHFRPCG